MKPGDKVICTFGSAERQCTIVEHDASQGRLSPGWHVILHNGSGGRFYVNEERHKMRLVEDSK